MSRSGRARCVPVVVAAALHGLVALAPAGAEPRATAALHAPVPSPVSAIPMPGPGRSPAIELSDEETTYIEAPPFPGAIDDWVRLQLGSFWLPDAGLGEGRVDLYQPELRIRGNLPIMDRFVVRVNGIFGTSHYDFREGQRFGRLESDQFVLYRTGLSLDAALRLNPEDFWLFEEDEVWSLGGRLSAGSEFEGDAFEEGLATGISAGLGYRNGDRFRVSLGVAVSTDIVEGGFGLDPIVSLRWRPTPRLTVSDRGLGLRVAYQLVPSLELFASGHRTSDQYALESRRGDELPVWDGLVLGPERLDELTFRDRQWQAGAGFEWKYSRAFRVNVEAGAVVHRKIRLHDDDLGTLYSERADPSAFVGIRFELRV